MLNRLQKQPVVEYTPAVFGRPYTPRYCYTRSTTSTVRSGGSSSVTIYDDTGIGTTGSGQNQITTINNVPGTSRVVTTTERICYPAIEAIDGVPATANYYANNGWNGGARSITPILPDGYIELTIPVGPAGIQLGLFDGEFQHSYDQAAVALVARSSGITPVAHGQDIGAEVAFGETLRIERRAGRLRLLVDGLLVHEQDDDLQQGAFASVLLYALSDHVYDPRIGRVHSVGPVVAALGASALLSAVPRGVATVGARASGIASINGRFLVSGIARVRADSLAVASAQHWVTGNATLTVSGDASRYGRFGAEPALTQGAISYMDGRMGMRLFSADRALGRVSGELGGWGLESRGGRPEAMITQVMGYGPAMRLTAKSVNGEVSSAVGSLSLVGKAADAPFCGVQSVAAIGYELTSWESYMPPGIFDSAEPLVAWDGMSMSDAVLFILTDGVEVSDSVDLYLLLDLAMYEMVGLQDVATFGGLLELIISERVGLTDRAMHARSEAIQYAVNAVTGALGRYEGFGFTHFARCHGETYAAGPDGLYCLRGDTDNGQPLSASIDFGASDYGTAQSKRVSSVYAGIATDGGVYLRLTGDDGVERVYRATTGPNEARALTAKGLAARHWRLRLELVDASYADLDNVEIEIGASQRRLRR